MVSPNIIHDADKFPVIKSTDINSVIEDEKKVAKDKPDAGIWGSGASSIRIDVESVVDLNEEGDLENQQNIDDDGNQEKADPKAADDSNAVDDDRSTSCTLRDVARGVGRGMALVTLLYLFICSLDFLSSSFRLLGGKAAGNVLSNNEILRNPISGLMIGILATVLLQSSSTSTSIVVTMVASGILDVSPAIPIVMGANIGTSVTNTIVSMVQAGDRTQFRRAFSAATVHDMFNWLSVLILLPIEMASGYLYHLTNQIVKVYDLKSQRGHNRDLLKVLTKPFTDLVIKLDKKLIEGIATGEVNGTGKSLIKKWCVYEKVDSVKNISMMNVSFTNNNTVAAENLTEHVGVGKCPSLFSQFDLDDTVIGIILLVVAITMLCTCLILLVKLLNSMLRGSIAKAIQKTINADFPGRLSFLTGYVAIIVGAGMTILVQSSSIFTSALTPLVGIGLIEIERMYPLTLGSNIGTTATGLLAAMAAPGDKLSAALQIGLCHLFFNISGIILFYPVPFMRNIPIKLAKKLGEVTSRYRWFAILYLILMFFLLPASVFALSLAGRIPMFVVGSLALLVVVAVIVINVLQAKIKHKLPIVLQTWEFLPLCLRSLEPYDRVIRKLMEIFKLCCCKNMIIEPKVVNQEQTALTTPHIIVQQHCRVSNSKSVSDCSTTSPFLQKVSVV